MHERRKHQRYLLGQNCFITYAASVGAIVDICLGGLSCMCVEETNCGMDAQEKGVDIFCERATMFAQDLPVKVLDSTLIPAKVGKDMKFRKCHVQFNQLEQDQKNHIKKIILSHAIPSINGPGGISPS